VEVELSAAPIRDVAGAVVGYMAVYSDITERQERRRQAERQRDFLNAITEAVPSFLVAVDPNAVVVEHNNNRSFLDAFGWTEEEIVGKSFLGLIAREDDHSARMAIANAANGVPQPERESQWFDRSGNELVVAWSARPVLDPGGRPLVLVSGTDVTVRRRQEHELRASRARILQAEDEARRKLERNLHDGAQQRLVALSVSLRLAESKLVTDSAKATELLAGAREELAHALEELRELARGIHPAVLTDRGLGPALEALVARAPFPVELRAPEERLASSVEAAAYYVVAESLTNVAKYARASTAVVEVSPRNGSVEVLVSDDGIGGADPGRGTGLRGLADRVSALDGTLRVESLAGAGTRIVAEIPLPETGADE
jgi:PAS domain S-box-containing protein